MKYSGVDIDNISSTREKIFFVAIELFATKGFAAVSIRDIAEAVGIKPASIYNHFDSKEAILNALIEFIKETTAAYYARINKLAQSATCFDEVMDCLFMELESIRDITIYYGVALLSSEQFKNNSARQALNETYMKVGIEFMEEIFIYCISKGWTKEFDAKACSTFIMNNVFTGSLTRVQEDMNRVGIYDAEEMFTSLKRFLCGFLRASEK